LIVNDQAVKQRILSALSDEYSLQILTATTQHTLSALELSRNCEIPVTSLYRRLDALIDAGLIAVAKYGRTPDGKWYELYRSLLSRVDVSFNDGDLRMNVEVNNDLSDRFTRMWTSVPPI